MEMVLYVLIYTKRLLFDASLQNKESGISALETRLRKHILGSEMETTRENCSASSPLTPRRFMRAMIPAICGLTGGEWARSGGSAPLKGSCVGISCALDTAMCLQRVGGLLVYSAIVAMPDPTSAEDFEAAEYPVRRRKVDRGTYDDARSQQRCISDSFSDH